MSSSKSRWGLQYSLIIFTMSIPVVAFTAAAVIMFLDHQVWPGAIFTVLAFFTLPNVRVHPPKNDGSDDEAR